MIVYTDITLKKAAADLRPKYNNKHSFFYIFKNVNYKHFLHLTHCLNFKNDTGQWYM